MNSTDQFGSGPEISLGFFTEDRIKHLRKSRITVSSKSTFIFFAKPFPVEVFLVSERNDLQKVSNSILVSIKDESGERFLPETNFFSTIPGNVQLLDGASQFQVVVHPNANLIGNKIFVHITSSFGDFKAEGVSATFILCKAALSLVNQPPPKWFKDEGGKNNCIELSVKLEDEGNGAFKNKAEIPLQVALVYEDGKEVTKQSILQTARDNPMSTDSDGQYTLRFRVDEVSQRHQGQNFRIKIMPNTLISPGTAAVAPAVTNAFTVLSKRKMRQRQDNDFRIKKDPSFPGSGLLPSMYDKPNSYAQEYDSDLDNDHPQSKRFQPGGEVSLFAPFVQDSLPPYHNSVSPALSGPMHPSGPLGSTNFRTNGPNMCEELPALSQQNSGGFGYPPQQRRIQKEEMGAALDGVLKWTGVVLDLVQKMQWEHVACELGQDGLPDPGRPIYRCPSCRRYREHFMPATSARHAPNCEVAQVLLDYSKTTMHLFHILADQLCYACTPSEQLAASTTNAPAGALGMPGPGDHLKTLSIASGMAALSQQQHHPLQTHLPMKQFLGSNSIGASSLFSECDSSTDPLLMPASKRCISMTAANLIPNIPKAMGGPEIKVSMIIYEDIPDHGVPAFDEKGELLGFYETEYKPEGTVVVFKEIFHQECSPELLMMIESLKININRSGAEKKERVYHLKDFHSLEEMKRSCFQQIPTISTEDVFGPSSETMM